MQAQADLERLDGLARDLSALGNTATMVAAISHLYHKLQRAKSGAVEERAPASAATDELSTRAELVHCCGLRCYCYRSLSFCSERVLHLCMWLLFLARVVWAVLCVFSQCYAACLCA